MLKKIEHIGIAVNDLKASNALYKKLLGTPHYKTERVTSQQVETSFFKVGESKVELLAATDPDSVIAKFLAKNGEGLHHIAFKVENIHTEIKRLQTDGFRVLNEEPMRGADDMLVAFLHPKDTAGVLVELCMPNPE